MAALEAAIQWRAAARLSLDGRVKPGHDDKMVRFRR
jgi:hypothetical protein